MRNIFTQHPHDVNETYFQHFCFAASRGLKSICCGFGLIIHAVFPFLFIQTGSNFVGNMHKEMQEKRKILAEKKKEAA
ncbi:DUF6356 family protein [Piscirickettsia litoralis]|uniref:Capsule biosynthesis protein n=1 Tax=Piscirickettsia litoralis TaxID=1891921 RepID=A0ABX3A1P3_9GAMM|nr:DUF6356 family protein [Piscirickettsia litoralis]ODN41365.1 hypothetical protein BGC07_16475 [Piscirickettsia litoralis]